MSQLLGVIVPAYNCARYLGVALSSVRTQLGDDGDVWVIDDGSTDQTLDMARAYAADDPRFHVLTQPNSGGPAGPRNRAIALSQASFLTFLDPDDYFLPGKLAKQLEIMLAHPDVDMVFGDNLLVDEAGVPTGERYLQRVNYLQRAMPHLDHIGGNVYLSRTSFFGFTSAEIAGPSIGLMLRRSALERFTECFAEDLPVGEDLDLWFRIIENGRVAFVDEPLYAYRQHPTSLMRSGTRCSMGSAKVHARNYSRARAKLSLQQRRRYRARIASLFFDLGYGLWKEGNTPHARVAYYRSMRWHPDIRTSIAWLKTLLFTNA